jgi:hypothetical protein
MDGGEPNPEGDLGVYNTQVPRAANILAIQIGALDYAPTFGIDLKYFLDEDFQFQNESFKAYLIQVLASYGINVATLTDRIDTLFSEYVFNLLPAETGGGLIAR